MGRHECTVVLTPSALGKRDPILTCELRELRLEQPAQNFRALFEIACDWELSHIALDPHQARWLQHGPDVVEDYTGDCDRRQCCRHHGKYATKRRAYKYGRSDLERGQHCREVGEGSSNRVGLVIAIVLRLAVTAVIERQH